MSYSILIFVGEGHNDFVKGNDAIAFLFDQENNAISEWTRCLKQFHSNKT